MNVDWREGYRQGYKDGLEEGKKINPNPLFPSNPVNEKPYCKICGMEFSKPMGYVCYHPQCPGKVSCSTGTIEVSKPYNSLWSSTMAASVIKDPGPSDGMSYEEIYGSVVYQQNNKKEE
jgi:hypothetical protein